MAFEQSYPTEILGRLFYKNDENGVPLTIGDGDDNVFWFPGSEAMRSEYAATYRASAAIASACFNVAAVQKVSGATGVVGGCPIAGAQEFLGQFVNGLAIGYSDLGAVKSLDIESPSEAQCVDCDDSAATTQKWTQIELVCWKDCNGEFVDVRANIARSISAADPSGSHKFGGRDPNANAINFTLTFQSNSGWYTGGVENVPTLFELFEDTGGAVADTRPVSMGVPVAAGASAYEELTALCNCDNDIAGIPLTAAMVTATTIPDIQLLTGAAGGG